MPQTMAPVSDHDLLVVLVTKMDSVSEQLSELRSLVASKADVARVEKLEAAVENMRGKVYYAAGALAAVEAALHFFWKV